MHSDIELSLFGFPAQIQEDKYKKKNAEQSIVPPPINVRNWFGSRVRGYPRSDPIRRYTHTGAIH